MRLAIIKKQKKQRSPTNRKTKFDGITPRREGLKGPAGIPLL
jgi:hypothetical protein